MENSDANTELDENIRKNLEIIERDLEEIGNEDMEEFEYKLRTNTFGINLRENLYDRFEDKMISRLMLSFGISEPSQYQDGIMLTLSICNRAHYQLFKIMKYVEFPHIRFLNIDTDCQEIKEEEEKVVYNEKYANIPYPSARMFNELFDSIPEGANAPICFTRGANTFQIFVEESCKCDINGEPDWKVNTILRLSQIINRRMSIIDFSCCQNCFQRIITEYQHLQQIDFFDSCFRFENQYELNFNESCAIRAMNFAYCKSLRTRDIELFLRSLKGTFLENTLRIIGVCITGVDVEECTKLIEELKLEIEMSMDQNL